MGEGRMSNVMTQCNGLNQIQIQIQRSANGPGDPGYKLYMQTAPSDVIVLGQRENLGLVGIAIVIRTVQNAVNILGKSGTPDRRRLFIAVTTDRRTVMTGMVCVAALRLFLLHPSRQGSRKLFFSHQKFPFFFYVTIFPTKMQGKAFRLPQTASVFLLSCLYDVDVNQIYTAN
jgi:hypothetical protein